MNYGAGFDKILTEEFLKEQVKTKFLHEIAQEVGCSLANVQKYIQKFKIKSPSWSVKKGKDTIGKKYGKLEVIDFVGINHRHDIILKCKCDCGNICEVKHTNLKNKHTSSCKCLQKEKRPSTQRKNNHRWTGFEDISGSFFSSIKRGATDRKLKFDITIEDIWNLFLKQDRKCAISGLKIEFSKTARDKICTASLDRIDSSKGYTKDNIQWVHRDINKIKQNLPDKKLIELCKIITEYQKNKIITNQYIPCNNSRKKYD